MLKTLILKNLVLVEKAHIFFEKDLAIITGETGAGKTALIAAIKLLLGERADSAFLRKGCEKGLVQAAFLPPASLIPFFEEAGLFYSLDEELIITREINQTGKSRAFVGGQMVPAAFLQKIAAYLVDFVGQHAHIALRSEEEQRKWVDQFADISYHAFQQAWKEEKEARKELTHLIEIAKTRKEREKVLEMQLKELQEAAVEEGEDKILFEEYSLLSNSLELLEKCSQILSLTEEAFERTNQLTSLISSIEKYDASLHEAQEMGRDAHLQLEELTHFFQSFRAKVQSDPGRLAFLETRLKQIDKLKKKYGEDLAKIQIELEEELEKIEHIDEEIASIQEKLRQAEEKTGKESALLTKKRTDAAQTLAKLLSTSLQELNIPQAKLTIEIIKAPRKETGEDAVAFFLQANVGEKAVSVKDSTSGGELSRLIFALKIALSSHTSPGTMVFDEIDANVGGETATIMGEKLKSIAKDKQVICITHFPQVACFADEHFRVYKEEIQGRTIGKIEPLTKGSKEAELLRMLGGQPITY